MTTVGRGGGGAFPATAAESAAAVVSRVQVDCAAVARLGGALAAPARGLRAIDLAALLPDRPEVALKLLDEVAAQVRALEDEVDRLATTLAADTRDARQAVSELAGDIGGLDARIASTQAQLDRLRAEVATARKRQQDEARAPLGGLAAVLDLAIDNLVNKTAEKQREIEALERAEDTDKRDEQALRLALARVERAVSTVSAAFAIVSTLGRLVDDVRSKVTAVAHATARASIPPLVRAALETYDLALSWCDRLAAVRLDASGVPSR